MKPNELMIYDWVVYNGDVDYINPIKIEGMDVATGMCVTTDRDDVGFDGVWPIPLTAEILKKNGFGYVENDVNPYENEVLSHFYLGEEGYCENMDVHIGTYNKGVFWFNCPKGSLNGIHYVHELQHALRLCNIEKEIEL